MFNNVFVRFATDLSEPTNWNVGCPYWVGILSCSRHFLETTIRNWSTDGHPIASSSGMDIITCRLKFKSTWGILVELVHQVSVLLTSLKLKDLSVIAGGKGIERGCLLGVVFNQAIGSIWFNLVQSSVHFNQHMLFIWLNEKIT